MKCGESSTLSSGGSGDNRRDGTTLSINRPISAKSDDGAVVGRRVPENNEAKMPVTRCSTFTPETLPEVANVLVSGNC